MDSIFPFINPETVQLAENASEELPLFQEYAYDFVNNELLERNGSTYLVDGNEALKIWIFKVFRTKRFHHIAHSADYGSEVHTLIGEVAEEDVLLPELERFIIEALMVNPYIQELYDFEHLIKGASVTTSFQVVTLYGTMSEIFTYEGGD